MKYGMIGGVKEATNGNDHRLSLGGALSSLEKSQNRFIYSIDGSKLRSRMQAFQYLKNRGLLFQSSQLIEEALKSITSSNSIYLGIDPTAKGLHIGHLMACRVLKRFHDSGVKSIALVLFETIHHLVDWRSDCFNW